MIIRIMDMKTGKDITNDIRALHAYEKAAAAIDALTSEEIDALEQSAEKLLTEIDHAESRVDAWDEETGKLKPEADMLIRREIKRIQNQMSVLEADLGGGMDECVLSDLKELHDLNLYWSDMLTNC
jgi:predicted  nucleic acid-binding Zn-ribbon protein